jgi:hypothetical protein
VSGFARFEYNVASARQFTQDNTGFRSIGRLNLDARTQTAYGTLRSFVRFDMARRTGHFFSGTAIRRGEAEPASGIDFFNKAQTQITLERRSSSSLASRPVARRRSSTSTRTT